MYKRQTTPPVSFHVQHTEGEKFQVVPNGTAIRDYATRDAAQTYIDTYRHVAARLKTETPEQLPIEAMTEEEWKILHDDGAVLRYPGGTIRTADTRGRHRMEERGEHGVTPDGASQELLQRAQWQSRRAVRDLLHALVKAGIIKQQQHGAARQVLRDLWKATDEVQAR